ncbi:histidinol dehydrogenase [Kocuria rhizophila]|nr:histidinol dehydrogenase [Kocuria rhizophila]
MAHRFDGAEQDRIRVAPAADRAGRGGAYPAVRRALETAIARTRAFAVEGRSGRGTWRWKVCRQRCATAGPPCAARPHIPGDWPVYPSSAATTRCRLRPWARESVVPRPPPQKEFGGLPHPVILGRPGLLGVGMRRGRGRRAVPRGHGAGRHGRPGRPGTREHPPAPAHFVATAKRQLRSLVGVDAEAGTTEIAVLADDSAVSPVSWPQT